LNPNEFVSKYAMMNSSEDFSETFAFYSMYRKPIKEQISNNKSWMSEGLKSKFEFMEKLW
jgi:hypothetical protein